MSSGAAPPTEVQLAEGADYDCKNAAIRGSSLSCLLDLYVMLLGYCSDPGTGLPYNAHEEMILAATRIASAWDVLDPKRDYDGYTAGSSTRVCIGV